MADLLATLQELEHLDVGFVSLTDALDLTTPAGRARAGLLAIFAEFEREILRERTRAGMAQGRLDGKRLGRPVIAGLHAAEIRKLHCAGVAKAEIARRLETGRSSVRRILSRADQSSAFKTARPGWRWFEISGISGAECLPKPSQATDLHNPAITIAGRSSSG